MVFASAEGKRAVGVGFAASTREARAESGSVFADRALAEGFGSGAVGVSFAVDRYPATPDTGEKHKAEKGEERHRTTPGGKKGERDVSGWEAKNKGGCEEEKERWGEAQAKTEKVEKAAVREVHSKGEGGRSKKVAGHLPL